MRLFPDMEQFHRIENKSYYLTIHGEWESPRAANAPKE
jgi:hypothetical protein